MGVEHTAKTESGEQSENSWTTAGTYTPHPDIALPAGRHVARVDEADRCASSRTTRLPPTTLKHRSAALCAAEIEPKCPSVLSVPLLSAHVLLEELLTA